MEEVPFRIAKKNNADRKQTKRIEANFLHEFSKFSTRFGSVIFSCAPRSKNPYKILKFVV